MKTIFLGMLTALLFLGCSDDDIETPAAFQTVALEFDLTFEGAPFSFTPTYYTLFGGERVRFTRIKWLLSGIRVVSGADTVFADVPYAYFNPNRQIVTANVQFPKTIKNASHLIFEVGVDESANHGDPNVWPPNHPMHPMVNQLHWGWADGYVFALMEGFEDTPGGEEPIVYHIGFLENLQTRSFELSDETLPSKWAFVLEVDKIFSAADPFSISEQGRFTHSVNDGGLANKLSKKFSNAIIMQ